MPSAQMLVAAGAFTSVDIDAPTQLASTMTSAGQTPPTSQSGLALIDTGATMTCVHEDVLTEMGLNPVSTVMSGTAAGQVQQSVYMVKLSFPQLGWSGDLPVAAVPQSIVSLLGRNLLMNWLLVWNGLGGHYSIST